MARNEVSIVIKARNLASKTLGAVTKGIKRLSGVAKSMGRIAGRGFRMLRNGALAAGAAMVTMVKVGNQFRQQMALVATMLPAGASQMRTFTKEVIRLSAELGIAKSTLADGLYQTLSAGVPADNALTFLTVAAKAAVGGATDVATAVDGLTSVMNAYGIEARHVTEVSDIMFAIVRDGKTTYAELADNISKVAPIAKVAGLTLRELGATIAALVKVEKPERAMTALTAAMTEAARRGQSLFEMLEEFEGVDFEGIIGAGITKRAAAGVALLAGNMDVLNQEMERFKNTAGAAEEAFQHMDNVRFWQKAWQSILANVTEFGMVLDKAIQPHIETIAEKLAELRDVSEGLAKALASGGAARSTVLRGLADAITAAFTIGGMKAANLLHRAIFSAFSKLPGLGHLEVFGDPGADPFRKRDIDDEKHKLKSSLDLVKFIAEVKKDSAEKEEIHWKKINGKWAMIRKVAKEANDEKVNDQLNGVDQVADAEKAAAIDVAAAKKRIAAAERAEKLAALNDAIGVAKQAFNQAQAVLEKPFGEFMAERRAGQLGADEEAARIARINKIRGKQKIAGLTISREDQAFIDAVDAFDLAQLNAQQVQNNADLERIRLQAELDELKDAAVQRDKDKLIALQGIKGNLGVLLRARG